MQGLFILLVWIALVVLGLRAPFVFGLGYIWVDLFTPQFVDPAVIGGIPVSLIMGAGAVGGYLLADRRAPPGAQAAILLALLWAVWITLTTTWAAVPDGAWVRWNFAVKTVLFCAFMPFVFRSRVQIEAAVLVIVLSILAHAIPFGAKTLISGGGYGRQLGLLSVNMGLGESSTLAVDCVAILPLLAWAARHSQLLPRILPAPVAKTRLLPLALLAAAGFAVLTTLGTYARSGLIALAIFAAFYWWGSKRKLLLIIGFCIVGLALFARMGDRYSARMSTIADPRQEQSAATRLAVWGWTYRYALEHPFGGGFGVYRLNQIDYDLGSHQVVERARAFHSIYFQVLGEHGFVGLGIFGALIATFFASLRRLVRRTRTIAELAWMHDLAWAMMVAGVTYFCGSAFIGVAFEPFHYYLFALTAALLNHYARATAMAATPRAAPLGQPRPAGV